MINNSFSKSFAQNNEQQLQCRLHTEAGKRTVDIVEICVCGIQTSKRPNHDITTSRRDKNKMGHFVLSKSPEHPSSYKNLEV